MTNWVVRFALEERLGKDTVSLLEELFRPNPPRPECFLTFQCWRCGNWFPADPYHYGYPDLHRCLPR